MMAAFFDQLVESQKAGLVVGLPSICSSHPFVLKAAIQHAVRKGAPLLIEATCNQVNQFGGYTGLSPADFVAYVRNLALQNGLSLDYLLLGGDHLGPSPWQNEPEAQAMVNADELIRQYVQAGFTKIHLDASMKLSSDPPETSLDIELSAQRAARLAKVAETTSAELGNQGQLRYVIGSEVPIPGGAHSPEDGPHVTQPADVLQTLEATQRAFFKLGLEEAWKRVIAVVVQPGVEFGSDFILHYNSQAASPLKLLIEKIPGLVYEAHSTDYQYRSALRNMVVDHFAILKVGPALTFAFREAVFALAMIEKELFPVEEQSHLIDTMESVMLQNPHYWKSHYTGVPSAQSLERRYSLSDRIRYYWTAPQAQAALSQLIANLEHTCLPLGLLRQFSPLLFLREPPAPDRRKPEEIIFTWIGSVLQDYDHACSAVS